MNKKYILVLDQGTTSSRAILFDKKGQICGIAQQEFDQIFPASGWVEHNPVEIWESQLAVIKQVMKKQKIGFTAIAALGITNQRETTVIWDKTTGKPIYNAIVWQDRRTSEFCDELNNNHLETIQTKTGLIPDSYFSATKIKWILENVEEARQKAKVGELLFGTIDSWLIWKLTKSKVHVTDITNASRTMLFNINTLSWDNDLLKLMDIPESILPTVKNNDELLGKTEIFPKKIPIASAIGDQQAALFGELCFKKGMVKNTYGTGCFTMMNTGSKKVVSQNRLLTTIAWKFKSKPTYALEGSVFIAGAAVQWLRDGLGLIENASSIEKLAKKVKNNDDVYFVPAFTGLGAPYWNQYARGLIIGLTRGTTDAHIARAALESIAFQSRDVIDAMQKDSGISIKELRVDGGASQNNLLMQFQADILDIKVIRPESFETTALGAAYIAGLNTGFWQSHHEIKNLFVKDRVFHPRKVNSQDLIEKWHRAVALAKDWTK